MARNRTGGYPHACRQRLETLLNSILTYIAGILVVLLFAALVGPSLVDWNKFRGEIEAQATEVAGRPVRIDGDIRFQILPAPHLTLGKIKIGNDPDASSLPSVANFATFEEIDAEVALAPLIGGDIKVTSVLIIRPQINLEVLPDGSVNWKGFDLPAAMSGEGMFSLASISLEKASLAEGTLTYRNRLNGRSWTAEEIEGDIFATSLLGPLRSELTATIGGAPLSLRFGLGHFGGDKAFRVTAEVETLDHPLKFLFSGVATEFSLAARLDGNGRLDIGAEEGTGAKETERLRVKAGMVVNARRVNLRNLVVAAGGTSLTGSAEARWDRSPTFLLDLSSENFTLDPLLDKFAAPTRDKAEQSSLVERLMSLPVPGWIDGEAHFTAGTLMVRDVLARDAGLDLSLRKGRLGIEAAHFELGGATQVSLAGALEKNTDGPRFEGTANVTSGNIAALAYWLTSLSQEQSEPSAAPRSGRPFSARAALHVTPEEIAFDHIAAAYAPTASPAALRGHATWRGSGERPRIAADLVLSDFDFDPLMALLPEPADPLAFLDAHEVELKLKADRLTAFEHEFGGVDADMSLNEGTLTVARFNVADAAGARLSFTGALSGVTKGTRDDVKGSFNGTIEADRFGGLLQLGGFDVPDVEGPVDLVVTGLSGEADDSQSRVDTLTLKGTVRGSRVDGVVKRRHDEAGETVDSLDIIANAANDNGFVLLEQLGLNPRPGLEGTGSVSVRLDGSDIYDVNFRANVGGTTLTALGKVEKPFEAMRFTGRADIAASGVLHVLGAFGAPGALSAWIGEQASGPGFVFSSDVVWDKESLTLTAFESVAGKFRLSGDAGWQAARDGKLPVVSGKLEANTLDLTSLAGVHSGEDGVWPVAALDWSALAAFDGEVDLTSGSASLGLLSLRELTSHISVSQGVLTASPLIGKFAGGRASIGARIEGGTGEPGIGLTVLVENAGLAPAFRQAFGAAPGNGGIAVNAQLQGQGRSWLALVSSVTGVGTIKVSDAAFAPLDVAGFGEALGVISSMEDFPALVEDVLRKGTTAARGIGGEFAFTDGVLRFAAEDVALDGGTARLTAFYDLPRLVSDAELTVTLDVPVGAPPFSIVATDKNGESVARADTIALQNFVSRRILAENVEETGADLPQDLRDLMDLPPAGEPAITPMPRPSITD